MYSRAYLKYKLNPYPKEVGENPIFVFNHIPKCGGTSLNIVLRNWFHIVRDYPPHDLQYPNPEEWDRVQTLFENKPPIIGNLKPFQILVGHYHNHRNRFSKRISQKTDIDNLKKITFVREPLAHRLSLYKYAKKKGHKWIDGISLDDYVLSETNFLAKTLECNEKNYMDVLDSYFFIGLTEDFQSSISRLAKNINRPTPRQTPFVNRTDSFSELEKLDKQTIKLFKEKNDLDYKVYEYAKSLFEKRNPQK